MPRYVLHKPTSVVADILLIYTQYGTKITNVIKKVDPLMQKQSAGHVADVGCWIIYSVLTCATSFLTIDNLLFHHKGFTKFR